MKKINYVMLPKEFPDNAKVINDCICWVDKQGRYRTIKYKNSFANALMITQFSRHRNTQEKFFI